MRRFAVICKIEMRMFTRDFFSFFFTLVFPVLMLLLFGSIYGNEPVYAGADIKMMDVCVPAYSCMVIGVTGLMSLPLTLSACKEKKIYKRFDATPVGKKSIIMAQVFVNLVMTFIGIAILVAVGKILYDIKIQGFAGFVFIALLLSIAAMFSMGFLFTAVGRDSKSTNLLCYFFYFIMLFLSGATMPDMFFPETIKKIASLLPMTHAVDLMQGIFLGDNLGQHITELLILSSFTIICTVAGAFLYGKKDWS